VVSAGSTVSKEAVGERFLRAVERQDWAELEACFSADLQFRALIPPGVREGSDATSAAGYFKRWFGDADALVLVAADVRTVEDRLSISYRFRAHEDRWYAIEQTAYCDVGAGRIERMDLLCSGFRPET
jgi:hypothetical protein